MRDSVRSISRREVLALLQLAQSNAGFLIDLFESNLGMSDESQREELASICGDVYLPLERVLAYVQGGDPRG